MSASTTTNTQLYYYEWGSEPAGHVSVWREGERGAVINMGTMPRNDLPKGAKYDCPYN